MPMPHRVFSTICLVVAAAAGNPISPESYPLISEVMVSDTGWRIEVDFDGFYYEVRRSDTTAELSFRVASDTLDQWYPVVYDTIYRPYGLSYGGMSSASYPALSISPDLDTVVFRATGDQTDYSWEAVVRNLGPEQSLSSRETVWCVFATRMIEWMKDNSPSMGFPNDTDDVYGAIEGTVKDINGHPVPGCFVNWRAYPWIHNACWGVPTDSLGRYRIFLCTQEDLVLRVADSLEERISADSVGVLHIEPDSTQTVDIVLTDYEYVATGPSGARARLTEALTGVRLVARRDERLYLTFTSITGGTDPFVISLTRLDGELLGEWQVANQGPGTYGTTWPGGRRSPAGAMVCVIRCGQCTLRRMVATR